MALAACGTRGGANGQTRTCALTLEGALSGSFDCRPATTFFSTSTDTSGFAFATQQTSTMPAITVAIGIPGKLDPTRVPLTFHSTDPGAQGGIEITTASGRWSSVVGTGAPSGSYVLTFTALDSPTDVTTKGGTIGTAYTATGTLDATVPAAPPSGSAAVGVHVVF